ncbi:MAG: hypothetical protein FWD05_10850, partial [Oscillospiraceae bacterium]|nr:hypothetical protein [Oscillospiraceae bacterium]
GYVDQISCIGCNTRLNELIEEGIISIDSDGKIVMGNFEVSHQYHDETLLFTGCEQELYEFFTRIASPWSCDDYAANMVKWYLSIVNR